MRRQLTAVWLLTGLVLAFCPCAASDDRPSATKPSDGSSAPRRSEPRVCLSLAALSEQVSAAASRGASMPENVNTLAGIGSLDGYVVDTDNRDVVLVGRRAARHPSLMLQDLLVSLRSAWGLESYPYCSLDPEPRSVLAMQRVLGGQQRPSDADAMVDQVKLLKAAWGPQTVVLGGVPRGSRHARVMIEADYHMKQVSQGHAMAGGIASMLDRAIQAFRERVQSGGEQRASGPSMSRFWFHVKVGDPAYRGGDGIVWLTRCAVVVLTERQRATSEGKLLDSGEDDPDAEAFARDFSERFRAAAADAPVYAELEDLYRLAALLRAMRAQGAAEQAGLSLQTLLHGLELSTPKELPPALPGLVNATVDVQEVRRGDTIHRYTLVPMVCGGVSMEMSAAPAQFARDNSGRMERIKQQVLKARPRPGALTWTLGK